jgi:hypothetical protein
MTIAEMKDLGVHFSQGLCDVDHLLRRNLNILSGLYTTIMYSHTANTLNHHERTRQDDWLFCFATILRVQI